MEWNIAYECSHDNKFNDKYNTINNQILLLTNTLPGKAIAELESPKYVKELLSHIVKMLNIFHHVYTNQKPLFVPKGQKSDLFVGSKELQLLNSWSYFGNDYFYLNLYKALRISYDAYKVSTIEMIQQESFAHICYESTVKYGGQMEEFLCDVFVCHPFSMLE